MTKYRKKPVVIDAIKFDKRMSGKDIEEAFGLNPGESPIQYDEIDDGFYIDTLEGEMDVIDGNYILRGVRGEFYPCQADIFEDTYEEVSEDDDGGYRKEGGNVGVYLAGDMLTQGAVRQREYEAEQLRKAGAKIHVPHEDAEINDKANAVQEELAERIVRKDTEGILESDTVVIDAHENGKGTLVELGQLKGMRDMANIILDVRMRHRSDFDFAKELGEVYFEAEKIVSKNIYAHNTDIRRDNTTPQAGDRREYAPNQYVYGTVLDLTDGIGFRDFEDIVSEISRKEDE